MKLTSVRELKARTSEMLRTVEKGNTVLVTTHGRPTAMLIPATEENLEDLLLSYSPKLRRKIEAGLRDIKAGRTISLSDYMKQRPKRTKK